MQFLTSFFVYILLVFMWCIHTAVLTTAGWKKFRFILSGRSDFHIIDSLSIAVHTFVRRILISLSVNETLLPRYMNLSTNFREPSFRVEMAPSWLKHVYSVLSAFTWRTMLPSACSRLCNRDSAWVGVFAISAISSAWSASEIVSAEHGIFCYPQRSKLRS